ncbi:hypothetical protein BWI93_02715 [Siphonobacter sp. BAB-5385]|uniref:hypothetical protein n=1 Tax=Siphonobacter sp. BAB-5385 TaxID=1864822 RepID=UPI000B9E4356|nr:hypothetical protein [Siphonobacter sp. BAB-5385]OZI09655.1 hypothetical protein BWI93_02715 [Siphonobacter sp. BAB-5385]
MKKQTIANGWYQAIWDVEKNLDPAISEERKRLLDGRTEAFFYVQGLFFNQDEDHQIALEYIALTPGGVYVKLDSEIHPPDMAKDPSHVSLLEVEQRINVFEVLIQLSPGDAEKTDKDHEIRRAYSAVDAREKFNLFYNIDDIF